MNLSDRMKLYEVSTQLLLPARQPTIIRVDVRAGHTLTKHMQRPFDPAFQKMMEATMKALVENVQTCVHGYTQSDEISLVLHPYRSHNSEPWFGNNVQKMVSISAAIASSTATLALSRPVMFDSRVFVLPEDEVLNYLRWRQQDARRNSISMLARSYFTHAECLHKSSEDMLGMLTSLGHPWDDLGWRQKYGVSTAKTSQEGWKIRYYNFFQEDDEFITKMFERIEP